MELSVAGHAKDESLAVPLLHDSLPECLALLDRFQAANMVDLERSRRCGTVFAPVGRQSGDKLRPSKEPCEGREVIDGPT